MGREGEWWNGGVGGRGVEGIGVYNVILYSFVCLKYFKREIKKKMLGHTHTMPFAPQETLWQEA